MPRNDFQFQTANRFVPVYRKRGKTKWLVLAAFSVCCLFAGFSAVAVYLVLRGGALSMLTELSAEEKDVKAYIEAGSPETMAAAIHQMGGMKYEPKKPKKVEFIQWGPHKRKSKIEMLVRCVYLEDGNFRDKIFTVVGGQCQAWSMDNLYGDDWIEYLGKRR